MGLEQCLIPQQHGNICFDCANACGNCSWSEVDPVTGRIRFEPVPGWTAKPVYRPITQGTNRGIRAGYSITACPEFVEG